MSENRYDTETSRNTSASPFSVFDVAEKSTARAPGALGGTSNIAVNQGGTFLSANQEAQEFRATFPGMAGYADDFDGEVGSAPEPSSWLAAGLALGVLRFTLRRRMQNALSRKSHPIALMD